MIFFCSRVWLYLFHASRECLLAAGHGEPSERGHERLVLGSHVEADLVAGADELYGRVQRVMVGMNGGASGGREW